MEGRKKIISFFLNMKRYIEALHILVTTQHVAQPDRTIHWFSPREPSQNHTVVAFVITVCHSFSLHPPLFLFFNLGELPLNRGSLRWDGETLDHFRAHPKTTPSFPYYLYSLCLPQSETSSFSVPVIWSVCCGLGSGRQRVTEWEGSHMLAV